MINKHISQIYMCLLPVNKNMIIQNSQPLVLFYKDLQIFRKKKQWYNHLKIRVKTKEI